MITLKSAREIEAMDRAGDFLASIHIGLRDLLKPGVDMGSRRVCTSSL